MPRPWPTPHYLDNLRRMSTEQDSIYEDTYAAYLANNNAAVHRSRQYMEEKYPSRRSCPSSYSSTRSPTWATSSTTNSRPG